METKTEDIFDETYTYRIFLQGQFPFSRKYKNYN